MNRMHEETRRRLLRAAFLVFCIVPTATVLGAAAVWTSPLPASWLARQLSEHFGADVRLDRLEHPRRDQLRLLRLELIDPENNASLLAVPESIATRRGSEWRLQIPELAVDAKHLRVLWTTFHDRIMRTELRLERSVTVVSCPNVMVRFADRAISLYDVRWLRGADPDMWHKSKLMFRLDPPPPEEMADERIPITIRLQRDRQATPLATEVDWDTGGQQLPVALIAAALGRSYNGPAVYRGGAKLGMTENGYEAVAQGVVSNVDLTPLSPKWLPKGCAGVAEIRLEARVNRRGLVEGSSGVVRIANARLPAKSIDRLIKANFLRADPGFKADAMQEGRFEAESLEIGFWVRDGSIYCGGRKENRGVLASNDAGEVIVGGRTWLSTLVRQATDSDVLSSHVARIHQMFCF